jgi:hypothetical protein
MGNLAEIYIDEERTERSMGFGARQDREGREVVGHEGGENPRWCTGTSNW